MSPRSVTVVLLLLSLSANAALLVRRSRSTPAPPTSLAANPGATAGAVPGTAAPAGDLTVAPSPSSGANGPGTEAGTWRQFETRDPALLAQRMRAAGFSVAASRAAVSALMMELYEEERVRALKALPQEPYWKVGGIGAQDMLRSRELARAWGERARQVRDLFPEAREEEITRLRARFGLLPDDKLDQLSLIDRDYSNMRSDIMARNSVAGIPRMPWTNDELRLLEEERRRDLAALLSPSELEEYNFRASRTAQSMGRTMAAFGPTESEFREIYRHRAGFDERFETFQVNSPEAARERRDAQQAMEQAIKASLGEARYAEYERANDSGFQAAFQVTQHLGLSSSVAVAAHQIQRDTEQRASALRSDRSQTPAQRNAALSALMGDAQARLTEVLSEEGWSSYRTSAGWWRNLERQAGTPGP